MAAVARPDKFQIFIPSKLDFFYLISHYSIDLSKKDIATLPYATTYEMG